MSFFQHIPRSKAIGAHRGNRSLRPENTRGAFEMAVGHCHYIELDVQMSRDGIPIIHHDYRLGRTSDGRGKAERLGIPSLALSDWDLSRLRGLDFGSWFLDRDPFGTLESGEVSVEAVLGELPQRIMTLKEVLIWARDRNMPLNIELKDQEGGRHERSIVPTVANEIVDSGFQHKVLVSSFRHDYLRHLKLLLPRQSIGVLVEDDHPLELLDYLLDLGAEAYHPEVQLVDQQLMAVLHGAGIAVNVFTVNSPEEVRQMRKLGVRSVITDFPHHFL